MLNIDKQNIKGVQIIKADVSNTEGEYIRHNPELIAKQIVEIIVNDMKFKDKKGDEKFILLNSKLKEAKKKSKNIRKSKHRKTKPSTRGKSKFISKYQDRIESIRESEQTTNSNKKIYEKAKKMTEDAEKKEKENFLKTLKNTTKNKKKIEK